MRPTALSDIAGQFEMELVGPDVEIRSLNYLDSPAALHPAMLTFAADARFLDRYVAGAYAACTISNRLREPAESSGRSFLVTATDPVEAFYTVMATMTESGAWETVDASRGEAVVISPSAVVHDNVHIGDRCRILDNAVIMPNSWLESDVVVKPNAVIGGDGFEIRRINGRRRVVPHAGGVALGRNVEIGSSTCVDRGLFGEFTTVGEGTKVDNLVHIAHRVSIGRDCNVIACAEVSGSVTLGDSVWCGPNSSINPGLSLGEGAFVGTGSVVTRDLPPFALAYGSPAKVHGWMCSCHTALDLEQSPIVCGGCGTRFTVDANGLPSRAPAT